MSERDRGGAWKWAAIYLFLTFVVFPIWLIASAAGFLWRAVAMGWKDGVDDFDKLEHWMEEHSK